MELYIFFTVCPNLCECSSDKDGNIILYCGNAAFVNVPDMIPDKVVVIDLSNNALKKLNNDSFSNCTNVTKLDLSNNQISVIWNVMLRSMPNLEIIVLDGNTGISYNKLSFPDDTFADLLHLKSVSIWCNIFAIPRSLDEYAFILQKLPHTLEELNVSIPGGENISQPLSIFTKLRKLGIQGMSGTFNTITNDTFKPFDNITIEELTITAFNLTSVEPLAFYHFSELKSLVILGFHCLSVTDFYPALMGLQRTKLEKLRLSSYYVDEVLYSYMKERSEMVILNESFCENLNLPHLTHLHLDHSRLVEVRGGNLGCFSKLSNLKVLNLQFNCFSIFEINQFDFQMIRGLTEINLSHQYDPMFVRSDVVFLPPMNLSTLDLSYILPPSENTRNFTLTIDPPIKYLNFQSNSITVLEAFEVWAINFSTPLEADFSRNNMISFEGAFDDAILNCNLIVESLFLADNQLGKQLGERGDQIFKHFRDLTKLDLTSNDIKSLPPSTFENLHKLEYLNLSKNALLLVIFKISHMRNLKLLDLSENLISKFNVELQNDIDGVKSYSPNFTIHMLGNPVQCSCETRSFLRWMYNRRSMFERFDNHTCTYNENLTTFMNMEQLTLIALQNSF